MSSADSIDGAGCFVASLTTLLYFGSRDSELNPTSRSGGTIGNSISSLASDCDTMRVGRAVRWTARPAPSVTVRGNPSARGASVAAGAGAGPQANTAAATDTAATAKTARDQPATITSRRRLR